MFRNIIIMHGGYMSSRLMNKLRIKKSLIYSIDSNIISNKKIKNSFNTCFNLSSSANLMKIIKNVLHC